MGSPLRFRRYSEGRFLPQSCSNERNSMDRRTFLGAATAAAITNGLHPLSLSAQAHSAKLKPMELGLLISPHDDPEGAIKRVHDMGFSNCFLSLDGYINQFTADAAKEIGDLLAN